MLSMKSSLDLLVHQDSFPFFNLQIIISECANTVFKGKKPHSLE